MKKYIVTYHMPDEVLERTKDTPPEEAAKGMEMWMTCGHPHLSGWDQSCEIEVHEALSYISCFTQ